MPYCCKDYKNIKILYHLPPAVIDGLLYYRVGCVVCGNRYGWHYSGPN